MGPADIASPSAVPMAGANCTSRCTSPTACGSSRWVAGRASPWALPAGSALLGPPARSAGPGFTCGDASPIAAQREERPPVAGVDRLAARPPLPDVDPRLDVGLQEADAAARVGAGAADGVAALALVGVEDFEGRRIEHFEELAGDLALVLGDQPRVVALAVETALDPARADRAHEGLDVGPAVVDLAAHERAVDGE